MKVKGAWYYLYRAIDRDGNLVDTRLSEKRDLLSAKAFFKQAIATVRHKPDRGRPITMPRIDGLFARLLVVKSVIVPANTSTIELSKTIVTSSSAIIPCVALVH